MRRLPLHVAPGWVALPGCVALLGWASLLGAQEAPAPTRAPTSAPTSAPIAAWSRTLALDETSGDATRQGAAVYNNWCDACHRNSEQNAPGTRSLQLKYRGELPAALEERTDLTPELVEFYVRNGVATMPFFRKTEIGDADLAALSAYLSGNGQATN